MAPRGPGADRSLPEPARGEGEAYPGRSWRGVRGTGRRAHADPRVHPGAVYGAPGENVVWTRGVVLRPRPSSPIADLDPPWGDARWTPGQRAGPSAGRWRRGRVFLHRGDRHRLDIRGRTLRGAQRPHLRNGR